VPPRVEHCWARRSIRHPIAVATAPATTAKATSQLKPSLTQLAPPPAAQQGILRSRVPAPTVVPVQVTFQWIEPPIRRRLNVPRSFYLGELHQVIQTALGRCGYHACECQAARAETPTLVRHV
jgi:hypothetical protein